MSSGDAGNRIPGFLFGAYDALKGPLFHELLYWITQPRFSAEDFPEIGRVSPS
jgi:hypothetical protein